MKHLLIAFLICISTFTSAIAANSNISSGEDVAIKLLNKVPDLNDKQRIYNQVLYSYIDKNQINQLILLLNSNIIESQAVFKSLSTDLALYFYSKNSAENTISFLNSLSPNLLTFLTETCFYKALQNNNINDAILFSNSLKDHIIYSRLVLSIIEYYLENDEISNAVKWFIQIELPSENDKALQMFCSYYAKTNNTEELNLNLNLIQSEDVKLQVYSDLAVIYASKNNKQQSNLYFSYIIDTPFEQPCLIQLIDQYASLDLEMSIALANRLDSADNQFKALVYIAKGFAINSNFIGVNESFKQITDTSLKRKFIFNVAPILAREKFIDEAYALTTKLELDTNQELMKQLAFNFGRYCDYSFSKLTLEKISDPTFKDVLMTEFALGLSYKNNFSNVLNSLDLINSVDQKDSAILAVINTQNFKNKQDELIRMFSPEALLEFIYSTSENITVDNIDSTFDMLLSFSSRSLSKKSKLLYFLKLAELYAFEEVEKKKAKYIKKAYKQLRKLKFNVDLNTASTFVSRVSKMGDFNKALYTIQKYPNKADQLYLMTLLSLSSDEMKLKKEIKSLQIFAKKYK